MGFAVKTNKRERKKKISEHKRYRPLYNNMSSRLPQSAVSVYMEHQGHAFRKQRIIYRHVHLEKIYYKNQYITTSSGVFGHLNVSIDASCQTFCMNTIKKN